MILGRMVIGNSMYGNNDETVCLPFEDREFSELLATATENIAGEYIEALPSIDSTDEVPLSIPADPNVKNYTYTVHDGDIYYRVNSRMEKAEMNATAEILCSAALPQGTLSLSYGQIHLVRLRLMQFQTR